MDVRRTHLYEYKIKFRIVWFCGLLIGYWLLLLLFPAHDLGSTDIFSREGNLTSHIDRLLMPGKLYLGNHDPEGILSTIPAIVQQRCLECLQVNFLCLSI